MVRCESLKLFNDRTTGVFFLPEKKKPGLNPLWSIFCLVMKLKQQQTDLQRCYNRKQSTLSQINYTCLSSITHAGLLGTLSFEWVLVLCVFKASVHLASDRVIGRDLFDVPSLGIAVGCIDRWVIFREFFTLYKTILHAV